MPSHGQHRSDHLQSPYTRNRTPKQNKYQQQPIQTPGSIFSKVKRMFSPSAWGQASEQTQKFQHVDADGDEDTMDQIGDNITIASLAQNTSLSIFPNETNNESLLTTPSNPFTEFRKIQNENSVADSPNVTLAKFFAQKGNQPLSAIELEGVKALLSKSNTPDKSSISLLGSEDDGDENSNDHTNASINDSLLQHDPKRLTSTTPSFKATYNKNKSSYIDVKSGTNSPDSTVGSVSSRNRRKVYDFSGFPSPYRTSRLKTSFSIHDLKKETEDEKTEEKTQEPKKLSNTATALLSFIQSSEENEEDSRKKNSKDSRFMDLSNPYATNRKPKKHPSHSVLKPKEPSAVERLEKSLEQEDQPQTQSSQEKPSLEVKNKYKPARSSSLRESITADQTDEDQSMEQEKENPEPASSTTFKNPSSVFHSNIVASTPAASFGTTKPFASFTPLGENKGEEQQEKQQPSAVAATPSFTLDSQEKPEASTAISNNSSSSNQQQQTLSLFGSNGTPEKSNSVALKSNQTELATKKQQTQVSLFSFPDASSSGYSTQDIDESKVCLYQSLFTF